MASINPHGINVIQYFSTSRELVLSEKMSDPAVEAAPEVAGECFLLVFHSSCSQCFTASEPTKPSKPIKAPALDPRLKQIKIKTGVLKRVSEY